MDRIWQWTLPVATTVQNRPRENETATEMAQGKESHGRTDRTGVDAGRAGATKHRQDVAALTDEADVGALGHGAVLDTEYPDPVDETLDDSFPASDPPSWTLGR